jgi:hypothetical protein
MATNKYLRAGKLGILRAGFLTAAALVAVPAAGHAQLISYTFTPGASATFAAGTSVFSGGFTFNTVTKAVTDANIVVTGAFAGLYTDPQAPQPEGTDILVLNPMNNNNLFIRFLNPLGDAPNTFATINVSIPNVGPQTASAVSGGVAPSSVVPEPGTWALLGTGCSASRASRGASARPESRRRARG